MDYSGTLEGEMMLYLQIDVKTFYETVKILQHAREVLINSEIADTWQIMYDRVRGYTDDEEYIKMVQTIAERLNEDFETVKLSIDAYFILFEDEVQDEDEFRNRMLVISKELQLPIDRLEKIYLEWEEYTNDIE